MDAWFDIDWLAQPDAVNCSQLKKLWEKLAYLIYFCLWHCCAAFVYMLHFCCAVSKCAAASDRDGRSIRFVNRLLASNDSNTQI